RLHGPSTRPRRRPRGSRFEVGRPVPQGEGHYAFRLAGRPNQGPPEVTESALWRVVMANKYPDFHTLSCHERPGVDFRILLRRAGAASAVVAPPGGGIRAGNAEKVEARPPP